MQHAVAKMINVQQELLAIKILQILIKKKTICETKNLYNLLSFLLITLAIINYVIT